MRLFMGGSAYATTLLIVGLLLAIGLLYHGIRGIFKVSAILLVPTMLAMVLMRDVIREGTLSKVFATSELKVEPQYGPLILFLAALALGVGVLAWMIKASLAATKAAKAPGGTE
jgi:hypothetical protein